MKFHQVDTPEGILLEDDAGDIHATVWPGSLQHAPLLAKAPELVAALRLFLTAYRPPDDGETSWETLDDVAEYVEAVLADLD